MELNRKGEMARKKLGVLIAYTRQALPPSILKVECSGTKALFFEQLTL